jgi:hypothetical protein
MLPQTSSRMVDPQCVPGPEEREQLIGFMRECERSRAVREITSSASSPSQTTSGFYAWGLHSSQTLVLMAACKV